MAVLPRTRQRRAPSSGAARLDLAPDCARCFGLCCVAPAFAASADFALDKPAGVPCPHLCEDFACDIHPQLRKHGFRGCTVFDCLGAGQKVAQETYGGRDWRQTPETAREMFEVFGVMRQLHELLRYLGEALEHAHGRPSHAAVRATLDEVEALTYRPAAQLLDIDLDALRGRAAPLLAQVSEEVRAAAPGGLRRADHRGADLSGADLHGGDLRGASFRGAYLIGANLRDADLRLADFTGADLRDADLRGADLHDALFLTQAQLVAAAGDGGTRLPRGLKRPGHW